MHILEPSHRDICAHFERFVCIFSDSSFSWSSCSRNFDLPTEMKGQRQVIAFWMIFESVTYRDISAEANVTSIIDPYHWCDRVRALFMLTISSLYLATHSLMLKLRSSVRLAWSHQLYVEVSSHNVFLLLQHILVKSTPQILSKVD